MLDLTAFLPGPLASLLLADMGAEVLKVEPPAGDAMQELGPRGVRVTVVCPGPVPSEFQARAGVKPGVDSAILNVSPKAVAREAYRGLMANKRAVLPGVGIKMVPFLLRLFPRGFILRSVAGFQMRRRS